MRRFKIGPVLVALSFFIVIDSVALYAAYRNARAHIDPVSLTAPAPGFIWKDFDNKTHNLKELAGHVVVIHFWASWCVPCRDEFFPKLLKAASEHPDITFLTISSDAAPEKAQKFIKMAPDMSGVKAPKNVLYAWDPTKAITYDLFLTASYPESIILDPSLRMRRKYPTTVAWDAPDVFKYIAAIKNDK